MKYNNTTSHDKGAQTLSRRAQNGSVAHRLFHQAVQDALRQHKQRGEYVVVWQNGQIVTLAPEDIPVTLEVTQ